MSTTPEVRVIVQPDRYQVLVDGVVAGFTQYQDDGQARTFPHTVIEADYRGQGLAGQLIRAALEATRAADMTVIPLCPAVARFIVKNPQYQDLVPAERHAEFGIG